MSNKTLFAAFVWTTLCAYTLIACSDDPTSTMEPGLSDTLPLDTDDSEISTNDSDTGNPELDTDSQTGTSTERTDPTPIDIYRFAGGCYSLRDGEGRYLSRKSEEQGYHFVEGDLSEAASFFMKASDLGTYLFYDSGAGYLHAELSSLSRLTELESDIILLDDGFVSGAEWELQVADAALQGAEPVFHLKHRRSGKKLSAEGLTDEPLEVSRLNIVDGEGCLEHPELTLDAEGVVEPRTFDDGSVYGVAETHTHLLSNFGFGGGNIYHGSPFHRLGVEHALPDCTEYHGAGGKKDFFGYGYDAGGGGLDAGTLVSLLLFGQLSEHNHNTKGYPDFSEWPSAPWSSTHQTQYYLWLKRAWMGGLRFLVQHATTNSVICEFMVGAGYQRARYSCNDMVAVDRILAETHNMERYIDAQAGGPGKGFFRIVKTPEDAREVINNGKLAVMLGIETSNLFDCFSVPRAGMPICDEKYIVEQLDKYYELGVRAIFPVHKYDNAFTGGDGSRDFIELGNFINSGHWSNFVEDDCPENSPAIFDKGKVFFGGLNDPRDDFFAKPPNNMVGFQDNPILKMLPHVGKILAAPIEGSFCQNAGLTYLGEFLLKELMKRGMLIEMDHFNKRAYAQAFEIVEDHDYPVAGTHSSVGPEGGIYAVGGVSMFNFGRCRDPNNKGTMLRGMEDRLALIEKYGGYPGVGIGLDLNGFNGGRGPRFGPKGCGPDQEDPITYPFTSHAGDVVFTPPSVGNRDLDFNTEGMVHVGLLPEMIEDARRDAESADQLEPLFRSAEAYIRFWERSEERGEDLRDKI